MDLLAEARLASLQQRASPRSPTRCRPAPPATLGGARLRPTGDQLAVPGKQADLAAFRVSDLGSPAEDPLAALVFAAGQVQAHRVVIAGVERVRDGVVTGLDPLVAARVRDAGTRLAQWRRARASR
jgi:cytosine/adenosine deaminase-related metal-dependent hydrolase